MSMIPTELRESVPAVDDVRYMNTGASGPTPRSVLEAGQAELESHEWESAGDDGPYPHAFNLYDTVRDSIASFIQTTSEEIALTQSTSDGINRIATAIEWEPGDVIVRTDLEHPAGVLPWERLKQKGCEVRVVPTENGRIHRDDFTDAIQGAKLVCLSAITWNYGTVLPVAELSAEAADAGAFVLVDAVQWPGHLPLDVSSWDAHAVAMASHKWMLGLWGAGFLYIDRAALSRLEPAQIGYRSVAQMSSGGYELHSGAQQFEVGTTSTAPYVALDSAVTLLEDIGLPAIESHILSLAELLTDSIDAERIYSPRDPETGLVTIQVENPDTTIERCKDEYNLVLRTLPEPSDAIRASIHAYNTREDVEILVEALDRIAK